MKLKPRSGNFYTFRPGNWWMVHILQYRSMANWPYTALQILFVANAVFTTALLNIAFTQRYT